MASLNEISRPSSTSSMICSAPSSSLLPGRAGHRDTERHEAAKDLRSKAPTLVSFTVHRYSPPSQFAFQRAKMQVPGKWQRVSLS